MTTNHENTLAMANAAIAAGDIEGFLAFCTDDTVWNFVGDRTLRGKAAVRAWMVEAYEVPPRFDVHRMIADAEHVVALGEITLHDDEAGTTRHWYCDVWRFRDGRMAELQAYVVDKPDGAGDQSMGIGTA